MNIISRKITFCIAASIALIAGNKSLASQQATTTNPAECPGSAFKINAPIAQQHSPLVGAAAAIAMQSAQQQNPAPASNKFPVTNAPVGMLGHLPMPPFMGMPPMPPMVHHHHTFHGPPHLAPHMMPYMPHFHPLAGMPLLPPPPHAMPPHPGHPLGLPQVIMGPDGPMYLRPEFGGFHPNFLAPAMLQATSQAQMPAPQNAAVGQPQAPSHHPALAGGLPPLPMPPMAPKVLQAHPKALMPDNESHFKKAQPKVQQAAARPPQDTQDDDDDDNNDNKEGEELDFDDADLPDTDDVDFTQQEEHKQQRSPLPQDVHIKEQKKKNESQSRSSTAATAAKLVALKVKVSLSPTSASPSPRSQANATAVNPSPSQKLRGRPRSNTPKATTPKTPTAQKMPKTCDNPECQIQNCFKNLNEATSSSNLHDILMDLDDWWQYCTNHLVHKIGSQTIIHKIFQMYNQHPENLPLLEPLMEKIALQYPDLWKCAKRKNSKWKENSVDDHLQKIRERVQINSATPTTAPSAGAHSTSSSTNDQQSTKANVASDDEDNNNPSLILSGEAVTKTKATVAEDEAQLTTGADETQLEDAMPAYDSAAAAAGSHPSRAPQKRKRAMPKRYAHNDDDDDSGTDNEDYNDDISDDDRPTKKRKTSTTSSSSSTSSSSQQDPLIAKLEQCLSKHRGGKAFTKTVVNEAALTRDRVINLCSYIRNNQNLKQQSHYIISWLAEGCEQHPNHTILQGLCANKDCAVNAFSAQLITQQRTGKGGEDSQGRMELRKQALQSIYNCVYTTDQSKQCTDLALHFIADKTVDQVLETLDLHGADEAMKKMHTELCTQRGLSYKPRKKYRSSKPKTRTPRAPKTTSSDALTLAANKVTLAPTPPALQTLNTTIPQPNNHAQQSHNPAHVAPYPPMDAQQAAALAAMLAQLANNNRNS